MLILYIPSERTGLNDDATYSHTKKQKGPLSRAILFQIKFYYYEKHIYNVRDCCINHDAKLYEIN